VSEELVATIQAGYGFDGEAVQLGVLMDGAPVVEAPIRIPLAMFNRHGLAARGAPPGIFILTAGRKKISILILLVSFRGT